jgi:hypothetical protein
MDSEPARSESARDARKRIHEEHENLKRLLERIGSATDLGALVPRLKELRPLLASHFEHEEGVEGLEQAVLDPSPHLEERVKAILDEHRVFLDDLDDILDRAREVLDVTTPNLLLDVADLTRRLHDHEIRETELLTDAKYIDLGDKD